MSNRSELLTTKLQLNEMPQLVPPVEFGLDNLNYNKQLLSKYLLDHDIKLLSDKFDKGSKLYKLKNKIFLVYNDQIKYFVQFDVNYIGFLKSRVITQVKLWRSIVQSPDAINFPTYMFFHYLLPITGIILTDKQQTEEGSRFWGDRIFQAIDLNYFVYYINLLAPNKELIKIDSVDDYQSIFIDKDLLNTPEANKAKGLIISKSMLNLNSG